MKSKIVLCALIISCGTSFIGAMERSVSQKQNLSLEERKRVIAEFLEKDDFENKIKNTALQEIIPFFEGITSEDKLILLQIHNRAGYYILWWAIYHNNQEAVTTLLKGLDGGQKYIILTKPEDLANNDLSDPLLLNVQSILVAPKNERKQARAIASLLLEGLTSLQISELLIKPLKDGYLSDALAEALRCKDFEMVKLLTEKLSGADTYRVLKTQLSRKRRRGDSEFYWAGAKTISLFCKMLRKDQLLSLLYIDNKTNGQTYLHRKSEERGKAVQAYLQPFVTNLKTWHDAQELIDTLGIRNEFDKTVLEIAQAKNLCLVPYLKDCAAKALDFQQRYIKQPIFTALKEQRKCDLEFSF